MYIIHQKTSAQVIVEVLEIEETDYETIKESDQFAFEWHKEEGVILKLVKSETNEMLGLISLKIIPEEYRVQIMLLEVSIDNVGKNKVYDKIAGILIAFAGKVAFENSCFGFVSLISKTVLREHYTNKYGFLPQGRQMYSDATNSIKLISHYL